MITRNDVLKYLNKEDCWFFQSDDGCFYSKKHPELKLADNLDGFVKNLNIHNHSHFKCIYSCHASLDVVLECQECGTVIFTGDDEERYNHNLRCPVCSQTEQNVEFWTKEDIKNDYRKQNTLKFFEEEIKMREEDCKRYKKTGLNSWELWKKEKRDLKGNLLKRITIERMGRKGLKGLHIKISYYEPAENEFGSVWKKEKKIPLSFYAAKIFRRIKEKKDS